MAKTINPSSAASAHHSQGLIPFLASVLLEWLLMLLLFTHAVFYHLIMKFARYYNLPLPCLLCSRLANVLGKKKMKKYYQDIFCGNHKSEISSLVLCHLHCKLVDVRKMCETCLFSFATFNKSRLETYRLLVGKLGNDLKDEFEEGQGKKHGNKARRCSCCNERWRPRSYTHDLLRTCSVNREASRSDTQLPLDDDCVESSEVNQTSIENTEYGANETVEAISDSQPELIKDRHLSKSLDIGDAYNIVVSKGRQISSGSFKEHNVNSSAKISEDLRQLLSQISSFDMSPRLSRNLEEFKHLDPNSTEMKLLQKRIPIERNESLEPLDGNTSNMEGENLVDHLKRQIEQDKNLLHTLYKELEEERNASAIATNQAMAMITKLQEEKAALHMDASQYLRMMEEQAEYDTEALQNCNDLLTDKEMEIQDLEAELEHYRNKYPDEAALLAKSRSFEDGSFSRSFSSSKNVESLRRSFRDQMRNLTVKSLPSSPANRRKRCHIVRETDLEERVKETALNAETSN